MIVLNELIEKLESGKRQKGGAKDSGVPSLGAEHLNNSGGFKLSKLKYVDEEFYTEMKSGIVKKDDIILVKDGATTGKISFVDDTFPLVKACVNEHVFIIRTKDRLVPKYLFFLLFSEQGQRQILRDFRGATVGGISKNFVNKVKIPLLSLPEQKRIAAILDTADAYRQKTKALIEKYDQLTQSLFLEMFGDPVTNPKGWEEGTIGGFIDLITYGLTVRPEYHSEGIPLISAREIRSGNVNLKNAPKISLEDFQNLSEKGKPVKGDILFSKTGSIGHCAIVKKDKLFAVTQNAARIVFKKNINRTYAIYFLRSPFIQTLSQRRAKGNAVKDLQLGEMKKFKFLLPPSELQNQFAERIVKIEGQKTLAQESLAQAENLFNALLQKAFKGEL